MANFVGLVRGGSERRGKPLHYKGSSLHRVMPGFMLQVRHLFITPCHSYYACYGCSYYGFTP